MEQAPPAVHAEQVPPLQTMLLPQVVPLATLVEVATHVCDPVEQSVLPTRHGFDGVHVRPAVHDTHCPPLHTWLVPQLVPLDTLPAETHCMLPVVHEYVPFTQVAKLHDPPAVHDPHWPLLQTDPLPHDVPLAMLVPAVHTWMPVVQEYTPLTHGLPE